MVHQCTNPRSQHLHWLINQNKDNSQCANISLIWAQEWIYWDIMVRINARIQPTQLWVIDHALVLICHQEHCTNMTILPSTMKISMIFSHCGYHRYTNPDHEHLGDKSCFMPDCSLYHRYKLHLRPASRNLICFRTRFYYWC